jgi:hypothetical protein
MLSSYLFDASKATPLSDDVIKDRVEKIQKVQLNTNLNKSQIYAIAKAVEAEDLSLIQGPPGTGKSTAIAELIWQLAIKNAKSKILLTSEANLAVDNALDKLKSSVHNIVKPIRIAAGDKFSSEGLAYAVTEMKKWANLPLSELEEEDNNAIMDSDEYRSFNSKNVVLNRWMTIFTLEQKSVTSISNSKSNGLIYSMMFLKIGEKSFIMNIVLIVMLSERLVVLLQTKIMQQQIDGVSISHQDSLRNSGLFTNRMKMIKTLS